ELVEVAAAGGGHRDAVALDRKGLDHLGEDHALAAIAGRREVGDVVRDALELLGEARLARQGDVAGKIHGPTPAYCVNRRETLRLAADPAPSWSSIGSTRVR